MRIATFNVNSLAKRLEALLDFLDKRKVDLALLQELKCPEERFPHKALLQAGWQTGFVAEKAYNGVAVLSRDPALSVRCSALPLLEQAGEDAQARYVEVRTHGLVAASIYAPNGNPLGNPLVNPSVNPSVTPLVTPHLEGDGTAFGEKFCYKIAWMDRLCRHVEERLLLEGRPFLLGGDFNVCPQPQDVFDEQAMEGDALLHEKSRRRYRRLIYSGLVDAFRAVSNPQHKEKGYTYWDYRRSRFQRDEGLRIDMFLLSSALGERIKDCFVERSLRAGEQPSDHAPLCLDLAWQAPAFDTKLQARPKSELSPTSTPSVPSLQSRLVM